MTIDINYSQDTITSTDYGIELVSALIAAYNEANGSFNRANAVAGLYNIALIAGNGMTVNTGIVLTLSSNGTFVIAANNASTSAVGVVQLTDSQVSTSTTTAATPNSVKLTNDAAQASFLEANSFQSIINSAFAAVNTATTNLTIQSGVDLSQNANTAAAFAEANSFQSIINSAFVVANSAQNLAISSYGRANTIDGIASLTLTGTSGVAVGGGSTGTLTANGTLALTGNASSTTQVGVVQLNDTTLSQSTSLAATANAVNTVWAYAQSAFTKANVGLSQTFITSNLTVNGSSSLTISGNSVIVLAANIANTTQYGVTILNDTVLSQSTTQAATANAVNTVWAYAQAAFVQANTGGGGAGGGATTYIVNTSQPGLTVNTGVDVTLTGNNTLILAANASSTTQVGVVQLTDSVLSTSTTTAATPNAIITVMNQATAAFAEANSFQSIINSAFIRANTNDGIGTFTLTGTSGVAIGGGSTETLSANGTLAITGNASSTTQVGVVQLNDTIISVSTTQAGTANSVNAVNTLAFPKSGGQVTGNIFATGTVTSNTLNVATFVGNIALSWANSGTVMLANSANVTTLNVANTLNVGFRCVVTQLGTGNVQFGITPGVVLNPRYGTLFQTTGQFASMSLFCYQATTANLWFIVDGSIQ